MLRISSSSRFRCFGRWQSGTSIRAEHDASRRPRIHCEAILGRIGQLDIKAIIPLNCIRALSFVWSVCLIAISFGHPAWAQTPTSIGDTRLEVSGDSGNANLELAQSAALSQSATLVSLSFYVTHPSGNLMLGIYDASGPRGGPGKLVAETGSFATANGWNTANVATPVTLSAGNYWLAYLPSSNNLAFLKQNSSGNCVYMAQSFSTGMPATFASSIATCSPTTWSFYATVVPTGDSSSAASGFGGRGSRGGRSGGGGSGGASPTNGLCGSANGVAASATPTSNLCSAGTASAVSGSGPWNWMCVGSNGGTTSSCQAPLGSPAPVNGLCGSASGVAVSTTPTANLCSTGTASAVSGSGPWNWMCTGSNGGTTGSCDAPPAGDSGGGTTGSSGGSGSPTLIQHVASSANPVGLGVPGNNFKIPLPNPVLSGDALVLAITYPNGNTSRVTDSLGQNWPAAAITKDGGAGNYVTQIYVLCGSAGGNETISVGLTGSSLPFEYTVSEFNNVATSGCVDGSVGAANIAPNGSAVINPGSFTPATNNDAGGGHIIWNYTAISTNANGNPTSWTAAAGFTLLDGDIAWFDSQGFPHASQWALQSTNALVTPSIVATGDKADTFNSVSVALRAASAGGTMPSGIHINKILHESWTALSGTLNLLLPATGNLRVLAFAAGLNNINITSITDSEGGTWIPEQTGGDSAQIWFAANRSANPNLKVSIHTSGASPTNSVRFFDIQGASASPLDVAAGTDLTACTASPISNQPTITPTGANELVIATMGDGDGPVLGLAPGAPNGATWDLTTYSGEVDNDLMENADALAHVYTTTAGIVNWNWTITPRSNNSCSAEAVAFK